MHLPQQFTETIIAMWGATGKMWLERLPQLIDQLTALWNLKHLTIADNLSYNFVAKAYSDSYYSGVILKISIDNQLLSQEIEALNYFDGKGCCKLFATAPEFGAVLLELLDPGISLKSLFPDNDLEAVYHAISVIKKLHKHPIIMENNSNFTTIEGWLVLLQDFNSDNLPQQVLENAYALAHNLLQSQKELYLLHGDLHHENILLSSYGWTAIDPKGIIGELAYEVGAFIRNPIQDLLRQPNRQEIISQRFDVFSEHLEIDRQRLIDWSYTQAVLATCWAIEDNNPLWEDFLQCAFLIEKELLSI